MRKVSVLFSVAAISAGLLMASAPTASAAGTGCTVEGARGSWSGSWSSSTTLKPLVLSVTDVLADGHHPAVQLVTRNNAGAYKWWPWHHVYGGLGDDGSWSTSATDSS